MKAGSDRYKLPIKITEEEKEETATSSVTVTKEISVASGVAAALLELGGIFAL